MLFSCFAGIWDNPIIKRFIRAFVIVDLYDLSAVGCPDVIDLNEFTWFRRTKDGQGIVGCHHSNVTWKLSCHDNVWTGAYRACSGRTYKRLPL